jgi:hypothetical protein
MGTSFMPCRQEPATDGRPARPYARLAHFPVERNWPCTENYGTHLRLARAGP